MVGTAGEFAQNEKVHPRSERTCVDDVVIGEDMVLVHVRLTQAARRRNAGVAWLLMKSAVVPARMSAVCSKALCATALATPQGRISTGPSPITPVAAGSGRGSGGSSFSSAGNRPKFLTVRNLSGRKPAIHISTATLGH